MSETTDDFVKASFDFHLEQLKGLRTEIEKSLEDTRTTEKGAIVASGAIYTFLFTTARSNANLLPLVWVVWLVPLAISVAAAVRVKSLHHKINGIAKYIAIGEQRFRLDALPGWETWLEVDTLGRTVRTAPLDRRIWLCLLVINLLFSCMGITAEFQVFLAGMTTITILVSAILSAAVLVAIWRPKLTAPAFLF